MGKMVAWATCAFNFVDTHNGAVTAIATIFIAVFTVILAIVTSRQARLAQAAIKLATDEFNATHRPKLHVRNIVIKPSFSKGKLLTGQFYISNVGSSPATITESHCESLCNVNGLPMERPYEGLDGNNPIGKKTLLPGQSWPALFQSETPFLGFPEAHRLFVMGWVEYVDNGGTRRRTAFCREYIEKDGGGRFYAVTDPDYEHEE
jgi:hypothetical protein